MWSSQATIDFNGQISFSRFLLNYLTPKAYPTICQCTDIIIANTLSGDLLRLWIVDCLNLLFVHVPRLMNNSCLPKLSHQYNRKRTHARTFNFGGVQKSPRAKILYLSAGERVRGKRIWSTLAASSKLAKQFNLKMVLAFYCLIIAYYIFNEFIDLFSLLEYSLSVWFFVCFGHFILCKMIRHHARTRTPHHSSN